MKVGGLFRHQVRCLKIGNNVGTARRAASHHTVVFLRHGESIWNLENRYTGWCDVPLTRNGELEAEDTGQLMRERGLIFDVAFTSNLQRAWKTCEIALKHAGMGHIPQIRSWKLNERHYGLLQGHTKDCEYLTRLFGEEQILRWRRSYTDTPPSLNDPLLRKKVNQLTLQDSEKYLLPQYDPTRMLQEDSLKHLELPSIDHCPSAESLKTCETRAYGYWKSVIKRTIKSGKRVLVVAHANTIRSLVKVIDSIPEDEVQHLRIPNGIPLVYVLDSDMQPVDMEDDIGFQANYLVSTRNHVKMMEYERCFMRKMRSLFQYFDSDGDGKVSSSELLEGLSKLKEYRTASEKTEYQRHYFDDEELIRCLPSPDADGNYTLDSFIKSSKSNIQLVQ